MKSFKNIEFERQGGKVMLQAFIYPEDYGVSGRVSYHSKAVQTKDMAISVAC